MWLLYDLAIHIYGDAISLAALFSPKAKGWVSGRKGWLERLQSAVSSQRSAVSGQQASDITQHSTLNTKHSTLEDIAWFHCASLGEFEQGRPVIEAFRKERPDWKILLTFFSPSGYEIRKNYEGADWVLYLPLDTPGNARRFVETVNPGLVVFVKYEYWFRFLQVLSRKRIPVYIISANFRPDHHFFRWYGSWALRQIKTVTRFFVQHEDSARLLKSHGIEQVTVSGDTRFDRVAAIASGVKEFPLVERFCGREPVFLAGSTWPADESMILELIRSHGGRMKFIIAPHEVGRERLEGLKFAVPSSQFAVGTRNQEPGTVLFSELTEENAGAAQVLIVDGIGYLAHLYQYATIAYIGGGFRAGIHNILEAATFGKPVIFGPKYHKFREAVELIEAGGAFSIRNSRQLAAKTDELLEDRSLLTTASTICSSYVQQKKGATGIILRQII